MAGERTLTVKILGDATSAQRALGTLDDATGRTESRFSKFGAVVKTAAIGAGLAAIKFGKDSVDAFKESEEAEARLRAAFAKFPALADTNIGALQKLNAELARKTRFDDDATASGQAVLAGFNLTGKQITQLTPLLQDYATRTGKDLPTAATDLGKAILGQGRALKAIGVDFKNTGSTAGNFASLTDILRDKVGGFAEKEGKTASGQAEILRNQFGELQEKVGSALVPALSMLANVGIAVIDFFANLNPGIQVAIGVVAGLAVAVWAINKAKQAWTATAFALNVVLAANPIGLVVLGLAALVAGLVLAWKHSETFRDIVTGVFSAVSDAAKAVFDWFRNNWPLLLAVLTGPFGLAVLAIVRNWDTIKDGAAAVKDWVVGRFEEIVGFFTGLPGRIAGIASGMWNSVREATSAVRSWISDQFNDVVGIVAGLPARIGRAAAGMWDGIVTAFRAALNAVIRLWNNLRIPSFTVGGWDLPGPGPNVPSISTPAIDFPNIPTLAHGGIVRARPGGTLALLGEAGQDEAVIPLRRGGPMAAAPVINVYAAGSVVTSGDLVQEIIEGIQKWERRNGAAFLAG